MEGNKENWTHALLVNALRNALRNLYDPDELRKNLLLRTLTDYQAIESSRGQQILISAIESLKPDQSVSMQSDVWRIHHTLFSRYIQQFQQREVAKELGLSLRQMRRQDNLAVRVLSELLWNQYDLGNQPVPENPEPEHSTNNDRWEEEIHWLEKSQSREEVHLDEFIQDLIITSRPLAHAFTVRLSYEPVSPPFSLVISSMIVRQALLAILTAVIPTIPSGQVIFMVNADPLQMKITIQLISAEVSKTPPNRDQSENLKIARRLIEMSGGSLDISPPTVGQSINLVNIIFPNQRLRTVLVIDDNLDTLQLFKRYFRDLKYTFVGSANPEEAIVLAEKYSPSLILLDVMLPGVDGWELLARLHEHPSFRGIPIVVSTILPQEQLALALGAAAFVRKPVSQADMVTLLNRLTGPESPKSY